ncbi:MAG: signal transduction histidine kinase/class 3 adenylate cyclase [Cryomorphaceae bacterium]|jgi:signal transduction histidine kinase/class 3 adenylate cyclase
MSESRQLSAIMFADIVGFSGLMQSDEKRALELRQKLKDELESAIEKYDGRIVKWMGDGVICTFNSAVQSLHTAIAVQTAMLQEPVAPMRIGIHQADVIFHDGDVHGDGVNITARLESFAIPGSIFISSKVQDDVKSQSDIKTVSLGKYLLKNMDEPVEIFAVSNKGLQVPGDKKLEGKGIKYVSDKISIKKKSLLLRIVAVLEILAIAAYFFIPLAALRSSDGTFYFGSDFGITTFKGISKSQIAPDVILSDLFISNKSVITMGEEKPFNTSLEELTELVLNYDQNDLSFEFTALHYANPSKNQYTHKLEGVDDDWIYNNRNFASYTNLDPGEYTFRIRAASAEGVWNDEGKSITVKILPPWWRTWWAYTAYALLFALLIFAIDRTMRQRIALREEKKNQERELAQAKEIEKAYHKLELTHEELKSAQQQLVQQEKLASLGQLTAGIAHEIKNPLNFVNNFSELNIEMVDEVMEELVGLPPEKADPIKELLSDVRANLQKILQHGTRADGIVKSMLQHSRGGSGEMEPTNLNALLQEFVNLAFHGMRASKNPINVKLNFDLDENLGKVNLIGEDFSRVVLNLANNAFDAMRDKAKNDSSYLAELSVGSKRKGERVEISISDNGPGIPDAIKDKILQPFFTTKKGTDGTGLGLSITNDIIKAHGGEINIDSSQGKGTTFSIHLAPKGQ